MSSGPDELCFQMKLRESLWLVQSLYTKTPSGMTELARSSLVNVALWDASLWAFKITREGAGTGSGTP